MPNEARMRLLNLRAVFREIEIVKLTLYLLGKYKNISSFRIVYKSYKRLEICETIDRRDELGLRTSRFQYR